MFLKTIQIGMKMICGSDLAPVKGGRKQDGEESTSDERVSDKDLANLMGCPGRKDTYLLEEFCMDRHVQSTATEFSHWLGAAQEKSGLSSKAEADPKVLQLEALRGLYSFHLPSMLFLE